MTRSPLLLTFVLAGCVTGAALRQRADAVSQDVKLAHERNAETCAAKDLAVAEANLRFAQIDLAEGDSFRAEEHLNTAAPAARDALAKSKDCGKVTVLIREKAPEAGLAATLAGFSGDDVDIARAALACLAEGGLLAREGAIDRACPLPTTRGDLVSARRHRPSRLVPGPALH